MHNMEVIVRKSKSKKVESQPGWEDMSFSAHLSDLLKNALFENQKSKHPRISIT